MATYPAIDHGNPPRSPRETLPTMDDLPSENPEEPGLPDEFHDFQPQLLKRTFRSPRYAPDQVFMGSDINLYYDVRHLQWYKRPDWFLAVGVSRLYDEVELRSSYVIWQEGVVPFVMVELLSPGTESEDLGDYAEGQDTPAEVAVNPPALELARRQEQTNGQTAKDKPPRKWQVYEQILRVPYYLVFSRYTNRLRWFQLVGGHYQEQVLDPSNPRVWMPELEAGIGVWQGEFEGCDRFWLRWYDDRGNWISTDTEQERQRAEQERQRAEQERQRAEQERQRAEQERQRAEQAELQLRQVVLGLLRSGMSIAQVVSLTQLSEQQIEQLVDDKK
jgi:Uma2 family endonuclease